MPVCPQVLYTMNVVQNTTLITLSSNKVFTFLPSASMSDVMSYQIFYYAWDATGTILLASATATYSYIDPCPTTSIITQLFSPSSISTALGSIASATSALWLDAVSSYLTTLLCGPLIYTQTATSWPATYDSATMSSMFSFTTTATTMTTTVSPTLAA